MPREAHRRTTQELIRLGKSLGYRVYSSDQVDENVVALPKTIDLSVLSSVNQIDVIWFDAYNFPKYAFEVEFSTGVDNGMQRLYQLRHYNDCRLLIVVEREGENSQAFANRFKKLKESDPYYTIADRFSLADSEDVTGLLKKALELDRMKHRLLAMELHPDIEALVVGRAQAEETADEVPNWVAVGKGNWSRHFTVQRRQGRDIFTKLVQKSIEAGLGLEVRINKYHVSLYSGGKMVAVIYPRRDYLVSLIKNIESEYDTTTLSHAPKPETDYIIQSATQYVMVNSLNDVDEAVRLLAIAAKG